MGKSKWGIQFDGFADYMAELDGLGADLKAITTECLEAAHEHITPNIQTDIQKHRRTGNTAKSIITDKRVEWDGTVGSIKVGFNLKQGGMPSIFLMYGTPRTQKDTKLYNDIYGGATKKKIAEKQQQILNNAIAKRLGG